jgi:two-component system sensor histidine kinase MprB
VIASAAAYVLVRGELREGIDDSLRERAGRVLPPDAQGDDAGGGFDPAPLPPFGGAPGVAQLVSPGGGVLLPRGARVALPVSDAALSVARGERVELLEDLTVDGTHLRVLSRALPGGNGALQVARPLDEVDGVLARIRTALIVVGAGGVALAALLGLLVSGAAIGRSGA